MGCVCFWFARCCSRTIRSFSCLVGSVSDVAQVPSSMAAAITCSVLRRLFMGSAAIAVGRGMVKGEWPVDEDYGKPAEDKPGKIRRAFL